MSFYKKYTPYIEAPTIRTTTQPVSGGIIIDTSTAQGTSIRNRIKRQASLLPQINGGKSDFALETFNFDQGSRFDEATPFSDKDTITAVEYLQDSTQFDSTLIGDFLPENGALEPLSIRSVAKRETTRDPVAHRIRGTIMCGNEDKVGNSDIKGSYYEYEANSDFVPYNDVLTGSLITVGIVNDSANDKTRPFDDSILDTRYLTDTSDINAQLLAMTGSYDDDFRLLETKAATSGFVYSNKEGTDSLAFGGLLKQ